MPSFISWSPSLFHQLLFLCLPFKYRHHWDTSPLCPCPHHLSLCAVTRQYLPLPAYSQPHYHLPPNTRVQMTTPSRGQKPFVPYSLPSPPLSGNSAHPRPRFLSLWRLALPEGWSWRPSRSRPETCRPSSSRPSLLSALPLPGRN